MNKNKTIKVLQVFNTAGVSNALNLCLNKLSHVKSDCVTRLYNDSFNIASYYGDRVFRRRDEIFLFWLLKQSSKYNIFHFHTHRNLAYQFKKLNPKKPVIMSYHGTNIRNRWNEPKIIKKNNSFDYISVSTKDLLKNSPLDHTHFKQNVVDLNLFKEMYPTFNSDEALFINCTKGENKSKDLALFLAKEDNLKIKIFDRTSFYLPYIKMPKFLSNFKIYIDIKTDRNKEQNLLYDCISYTTLQFMALSIGRKVYTSNREILYSKSRTETELENDKLVMDWIKKYEELI